MEVNKRGNTPTFAIFAASSQDRGIFFSLFAASGGQQEMIVNKFFSEGKHYGWGDI